MGKHLGFTQLTIDGDGYGPTKAQFTYVVCDNIDTEMQKVSTLFVENPDFTADTVKDFFDGYVAVIKSNEGVS